MIVLLLASIAFAADLPGEELYSAPTKNPVAIPQTQAKVKKQQAKVQNGSSGNLPAEYLTSFSRQSTESALIQPPKGSVEFLRAIKVGETIEATVEHSVIAFPDEKAPVIAIVQSGALRGLKFIGESYLEPNTKRIFVNFQRAVSGSQVFMTKAAGVSALGQPGLNGEYHSREAEYFTGDFLANFTAGYFDGLVPRYTNAFGQIQTDNSVDSATKKALARGALSTAERFREKLKKVPEFSEIKGPFDLKILILDQTHTTN